jgi:urea transport system substrate-binding protein
MMREDANYNALIATKAAIEKAGKEAMVDALAGLTIKTPTGPSTMAGITTPP